MEIPPKAKGNAVESEPRYLRVTPEHCSASVPIGGKAEGLPPHILVLDTGQPEAPPPEMRHPQTQEEVDEVYRWTIRRGIVDHHTLDSNARIPKDKVRCAAKMVADFPEEVLALVRSRGVTEVTAHQNGDVDALGATYLARALVQHGRLPAMAKPFSEYVNATDYPTGESIEPEKYVRTMMGILDCVAQYLQARRKARLDAINADGSATSEEKGKLRNAAFKESDDRQIAISMDLFNALEAWYVEHGEIDFGHLDWEKLALAPETREAIAAGRPMVEMNQRSFAEALEKAERRQVRIKTNSGETIEVPLIIFEDAPLPPTIMTNMTYGRVASNAIVAVFSGDRHPDSPRYVIGVNMANAGNLGLLALEKPFNEAEVAKRKPLIQGLESKLAEGTISEAERKRLELWQTPRRGYRHSQNGDPTVCVAQDTLIAASMTSLLSQEEFKQVLERAFAG